MNSDELERRLRAALLVPPIVTVPAPASMLTASSRSAITAWRLAPTAGAASTVVGLFALNGFLNVSWSLLFFRLQRPDWAMAELVLLWLSVLALILVCRPLSRTAALLLMPYLAWVTAAGMLNWEIVRLNGPFG